MNELTETVNGEKQLKSVKDNADTYAKMMKELIKAYNLYNDSVDTIVEVWKPMLNNSQSLKKTFNLLIMTEFVEMIWADRNIKIVIEEIVQNKDELSKYQEDLNEMVSINKNLELITQSFMTKNDVNSKSESDSNSS